MDKDAQGELILTKETRAEVARALPRLARPALRIISELHVGSLDITLPDGRTIRARSGRSGPHGVLVMHRWRVFRRAALRGDVGFGEAFMDGDFETPDLQALLDLFAANGARRPAQFVPRRFAGLVLRLAHALKSNTRRGSKRNIAAHYDLGNTFYEQWLDPSMTYSSALYGLGANDLETAQADKYRALIQKTGIGKDHHVLEIGCGWGGFAIRAVEETGCRVTGITLSTEQKAFADARIRERGLSDHITIELCDYRDVRGRFDRIVSIEMFEAVGERYWSAYFERLSALLKPGGAVGLQVITIRDDLFAAYRKGADFLQTYIFPGGLLPPSSRMPALGQEAGLTPQTTQTFGADYARTLEEWFERFERAWPRIAPLGFDERFRKMWLFYLASCEAGFRNGLVDVEQIVLKKPVDAPGPV